MSCVMEDTVRFYTLWIGKYDTINLRSFITFRDVDLLSKLLFGSRIIHATRSNTYCHIYYHPLNMSLHYPTLQNFKFTSMLSHLRWYQPRRMVCGAIWRVPMKIVDWCWSMHEQPFEFSLLPWLWRWLDDLHNMNLTRIPWRYMRCGWTVVVVLLYIFRWSFDAYISLGCHPRMV